jgi:hypothetical protein
MKVSKITQNIDTYTTRRKTDMGNNMYKWWGKLGRMKQDVMARDERINKLEAELSYWQYRHKLAREGRRFWRTEAKNLGSEWDYHCSKLRADGDFHSIYKG